VLFSARNILLCFLFWTGLVVMSIAGYYFDAMFRDRAFYLLEVIPFCAGWYVWFLLSFPLVYIARRYAVAMLRRRTLWIHLAAFLVLNGVQIVLSSFATSLLLSLLNGGTYRNILQKTLISGTFYNMIIYAAVLGLVNGLAYYQQLQKEKNRSLELEKQLVTSRMNFLKQQLQPHFLFNTHHSIITLMKLGERDKAVAMMEKLSDLMRFALRDNKAQEITLEKELILLQLYLDIQKVRFEDKLRVSINVAPDLLQVLVPSMILQPIVENAIKYAVERYASGTTIDISAAADPKRLVLLVRDETREPFVTVNIEKGIGLRNTEERLHQLYASQQHFGVRPFFEDGFKGLEVTIQIPLRYA
jgi:sensor histidine kinase YesM